MQIGEKIYEQRTAKGLSQEQLAELLEVSRQSVSKWETGSAVPELDKLLRMCDIFEISLDQLAGRTDTAPPSETRKGTASGTDLTSQKILGIILTAIALLGGILALLLAKGTEIYVLLPLLLAVFACGLICLCLKEHIGYWCTWAALVPICFLTPHIAGLPILSAIGGAQLLCFATMILWAAKYFPPLSRQPTGAKIAWLLALCVLCFLAYIAALFLIPYFIPLCLVNCALYATMAVVLTYTVRSIKTLKNKRRPLE